MIRPYAQAPEGSRTSICGKQAVCTFDVLFKIERTKFRTQKPKGCDQLAAAAPGYQMGRTPVQSIVRNVPQFLFIDGLSEA